MIDEITATVVESEAITHSDLMAKRDGATRLWTIVRGKSAKLVRDGVSFARIDALTDGTFSVTLHGERSAVSSWQAASAWLVVQATAATLAGDLWI
jgi:hypothetical protein